MESIESMVKEAIERIRPYIRHDGGDIELVGVDDAGMVTVRMMGACNGCSMIDYTIKDGVEAILLEEVPGIVGVRLEEMNFDEDYM